MKKFKKALSIVMALSMLASVAAIGAFSVSATDEVTGCSGYIGDTDLSGKISVRDATSIQKYAANMTQLEKSNKIFADVNNDSKINVKDASSIQKYLAKVGDNPNFVGTAYDVEGDNYEYWTEGIRSVSETRNGYATVRVTDTNGDPVEGVKLGAWHSYNGAYFGNALDPAYLEDEAITNKDGVATFTGTLRVDEAYIIQLYVTPDNYEWDGTFYPIMISNENLASSTAYTFNIELKKSNGDIGVYVRSMEVDSVAGATFKLYSKDGKSVSLSRTSVGLYYYDIENGKTDVEMTMGWKEFWDGDKSYLEIQNLPAGDYYLEPVTEPNGYEIANKTDFSITPQWFNPNGVFRGYSCPFDYVTVFCSNTITE